MGALSASLSRLRTRSPHNQAQEFGGTRRSEQGNKKTQLANWQFQLAAETEEALALPRHRAPVLAIRYTRTSTMPDIHYNHASIWLRVPESPRGEDANKGYVRKNRCEDHYARSPCLPLPHTLTLAGPSPHYVGLPEGAVPREREGGEGRGDCFSVCACVRVCMYDSAQGGKGHAFMAEECEVLSLCPWCEGE